MIQFEASKVSTSICHRPLHPTRDSVPREGLYLRLWQNFAVEHPDEWLAIFNTSGPVRQRAACVAASFMVFMGCNAGRAFTAAAETLAKSAVFHLPEDAYLAAWALENRRLKSTNRGLRTVEFMLAREHPIDPSFPFFQVRWDHVPAVSMDDMDIVESMVAWWSSPAAIKLRKTAEAELAEARLLI